MFRSLPISQEIKLQLERRWLPPNSPCFTENLIIVVQVGFITAASLQIARGCLAPRVCRNGTKLVDEGRSGKCRPQLKVGITYIASMICSILLLGAHFSVLLMLLGGTATNCDSRLRFMSAQVLQVTLYGLATIKLADIRKKRYSQFPWMLRSWWFCSFVLSMLCATLNAVPRVPNHDHLGAREYADFVGFLSSGFLMGIAIRGKTGFSVLDSNQISQPLLKRQEHKRISSYGKANLLQLVTFSWLNPLFAIGFKKTLELDEIPDVYFKDSAEYCSQNFDENLKSVRERDGNVNQSIYKGIFLFIRKRAAINAFFAVVSAGVSYVGPYLINDFVNFLAQKKTRSLRTGYFLVLAFLGGKLVETIAQRQWIFGARRLGLRLRAALTSHIYKKGIGLSSRSRQSQTSGEIINYMSVDVQRISDFIWYVNTIWMLPIQISLAMYILHTHLGFGSVAALASTLTVMACNIPLTRIQKRYQANIMEAKDNSMRATSEILRNMKILKLQAWDKHFLHKIENLRHIEHNWLWKSLRLSAFSTFVFWGAPTVISVVTFGACMLMGVELTTGRVLSALATFQMLQSPIFSLPDLLSVIAQGKVSADRIASFLREEEIQIDAIEYYPKDDAQFGVEIENGRFSWNSEAINPTLDGIQLKVKRGMKVAICGPVGSGKSSLLSCILGEIRKLSGCVRVSGTKAYVPQSPWILTGNIRENILFGSPYENGRYERTVNACALTKDFELFSCGDLTEIGERGINMSGGQKQRIQIARAVYQDADIYLLDDPFSAVDAHTGRKIFEECLLGLLKDKTVLYVTHQVEFLPAADIILVMQNGQIAQTGRFEQLLEENIGFEVLVGAHSEALESILTAKTSSRNSCASSRNSWDLSNEKEHKPEIAPDAEVKQHQHGSEHDRKSDIVSKAGKLVQDEEREKGSIAKEVYWAYLTTVKGGALVPIIILAQSCFQVLQIASNYWMAWASPPTSEAKPIMAMNIVLLVYVLLAVGSSLCVLVRATLVAVGGLRTAEKLFSNMLHSIFQAPMAFFDSTPAGRILNRVSTDQSVVDLEIAIRLGWCAFSIIQILGTISVMSQVAWQVFVIFVPVTGICIWYQQYYIPTARELGRLAGIQRAPILHHFGESLSGAAAIRAFDQQERFINTNLGLIDNHSRPWFHNVSAMEWLSFRLNLLSHFVFAFSLVLLVTLPEGIISPSVAGLGVTYGISLNVLQATVIWNICNAEDKMISVERILQYSSLAKEAPTVIADNRPPNNWPDVGTIVFSNLNVCYAEHLPSVLENISCTFPGGEKVGVVGRTGSGKSTLVQAIFRVVEARQGTIIIDGVDISKIGLHDLRSRLSIIPQDPTMFEGSVRGNLDPLAQYTDAEVWETLDKCQLGELIRAKEKGLDATVVESGENWSVGQRQLFCLGRVLLKRSNILVLDEATASVDSATDRVIQKIISREFKDQTVVTIAHRIHSVIHSDMVLVLSDGRIAEFDRPAKLLETSDSFLSKLVMEYSIRSQRFRCLANN